MTAPKSDFGTALHSETALKVHGLLTFLICLVFWPCQPASDQRKKIATPTTPPKKNCHHNDPNHFDLSQKGISILHFFMELSGSNLDLTIMSLIF